MERLVCLALVCVAAALADTVVNPRGARPVEHGTRDEKCATQKEWPFCTDQDLGPKCPSGCRIQGLLDKYDHSLLKKVEKARTLLDQNKVKSHKADQTSKQTYSSLTEKLTTVSGTNDNYYSTATDLRTRITTIKITIHRQLRTLAALRDRVKDQVAEMQKLEVDIDIKLRSCKGSCARYSEYQVDKESYVALDKQVNQLNNQVHRESAGALHVMKSRPLQRAATDSRYKSTDVAGQQEMFANLVTQQFVIESDGSGDSLATVYKHQVCSRLSQQNLIGQQSSAYARAYHGQHCQAQSDVTMCSDDDWLSKCPSGCRVQGMISQMESDVERKLRTVCKKAKMYEDAAEKTMKAMTHVYNHNREVIVDRYISELKFVECSQGLARNLTSLQKKSSRLSKQLKELNHRVQEQVQELYRTEIDIDMKLRACRGSCKAVVPFTVRHESYETLQTAMQHLGKGLKKKKASAVPLQDIPRINLQPLGVGQASSADYKSIPTVQRELLTQFEDIGQNRILLEELLKPEGMEADSPSELE